MTETLNLDDGPTSLVIDNCLFQGHMLHASTTNVMIRNSNFQDCYVSFDESTKAVLENINAYNSQFLFTSNSTIIVKDSKFTGSLLSQSTIEVAASNITFSGKLAFSNNSAIYGGVIFLYFSNLIISPNAASLFFYNNSALNSGGVISMYSSHFYIGTNANLTFINNSAYNKGGAIYIEPGIKPLLFNAGISNDYFSYNIHVDCFFEAMIQNQVQKCNKHSSLIITFSNNLATNGGDDVYGGSVHICNHTFPFLLGCKLAITYSSNSSVSSDPLRVCVCNSYGIPQCEDDEYIFMHREVYPGESLTLSSVIVGYDYGPTTGVIYANLLPTVQSFIPILDSNSRNGHVISNNKRCTDLSFTLLTNHVPKKSNVTMYITAMRMDTQTVDQYSLSPTAICNKAHVLSDCKHVTPVFLNITVRQCPQGFALFNQSCDCYLRNVLFSSCGIISGVGYFMWNRTAWVSTYNAGILHNIHCPFDYCTLLTNTPYDLQDDPDSQCAFNRAGRLCGGCKENYSLAIGSSHCIHCPNYNNLALLIFFAAAGILLVFFISALNLTVTQGLINGLIFYANIVWTYQSLFFLHEKKSNAVLMLLKIFKAWINLDFGIETCFINGLTAFSKTWLQFVFPFYILTISGLIIMAMKHSIRLTMLLGDKAVPVLDTLLLLSYMKLLRVVIASLEFSTISKYPQELTLLVWSIDGNLDYFGPKHISLFIVGLATLLFLWLPYTLLLFGMQWLRRISNFRLLRWIVRFHPVFDAYFAPLKHKHHYWFGVLLIARGILLVTFVSSFDIPQNINFLLLLFCAIVLLYYMIIAHPYKNSKILILQSSFFANLALLSGFFLFIDQQGDDVQPTRQAVAVGLSTGIAFLQFCGIIVHAVITITYKRCRKLIAGCCKHDNDMEDIHSDFTDSYRRDPVVNIDEVRPLLLVSDEPAKQKH